MKQTIHLEIEFRKNPYSGLYIALEGIDGSGKSTQSKVLKEYFESKGRTVTTTYEPNLTLFGSEDILKIYTSEKKLSGQAFQYLLTANRLINHAEIIEPALARGDVVISDRCFWSAIPYGVMDSTNQYSMEQAGRMLLTQSILSMYHQSITPDMVFYLSVTPEVGLERLESRKEGRKKDIYEKKEKLERVVQGYTFLVENFTDQIVQIDGERSIDEISKDLIQSIEAKNL
jgi:dTMP kinase